MISHTSRMRAKLGKDLLAPTFDVHLAWLTNCKLSLTSRFVKLEQNCLEGVRNLLIVKLAQFLVDHVSIRFTSMICHAGVKEYHACSIAH